MRHRFVPDLGGLEHRFLLVKAFPTNSGSLSPPSFPSDPPPPTTPPATSPGDPGDGSSDPGNTPSPPIAPCSPAAPDPTTDGPGLSALPPARPRRGGLPSLPGARTPAQRLLR